MKKKVLLVQPNYYSARSTGACCFNLPLGPAYIAAYIERDGVDVEILDANVLRLNAEDAAAMARG